MALVDYSYSHNVSCLQCRLQFGPFDTSSDSNRKCAWFCCASYGAHGVRSYSQLGGWLLSLSGTSVAVQKMWGGTIYLNKTSLEAWATRHGTSRMVNESYEGLINRICSAYNVELKRSIKRQPTPLRSPEPTVKVAIQPARLTDQGNDDLPLSQVKPLGGTGSGEKLDEHQYVRPVIQGPPDSKRLDIKTANKDSTEDLSDTCTETFKEALKLPKQLEVKELKLPDVQAEVKALTRDTLAELFEHEFKVSIPYRPDLEASLSTVQVFVNIKLGEAILNGVMIEDYTAERQEIFWNLYADVIGAIDTFILSVEMQKIGEILKKLEMELTNVTEKRIKGKCLAECQEQIKVNCENMNAHVMKNLGVDVDKLYEILAIGYLNYPNLNDINAQLDDFQEAKRLNKPLEIDKETIRFAYLARQWRQTTTYTFEPQIYQIYKLSKNYLL